MSIEVRRPAWCTHIPVDGQDIRQVIRVGPNNVVEKTDARFTVVINDRCSTGPSEAVNICQVCRCILDCMRGAVSQTAYWTHQHLINLHPGGLGFLHHDEDLTSLRYFTATFSSLPSLRRRFLKYSDRGNVPDQNGDENTSSAALKALPDLKTAAGPWIWSP